MKIFLTIFLIMLLAMSATVPTAEAQRIPQLDLLETPAPTSQGTPAPTGNASPVPSSTPGTSSVPSGVPSPSVVSSPVVSSLPTSIPKVTPIPVVVTPVPSPIPTNASGGEGQIQSAAQVQSATPSNTPTPATVANPRAVIAQTQRTVSNISRQAQRLFAPPLNLLTRTAAENPYLVADRFTTAQNSMLLASGIVLIITGLLAIRPDWISGLTTHIAGSQGKPGRIFTPKSLLSLLPRIRMRRIDVSES